MRENKVFKASRLFLLTAAIAGSGFLSSCSKNDSPAPAPKIPVQVTNLNVSQLKTLSTSDSVRVRAANTLYKLKGVVISSKDVGNIDPKTLVLDQEDGSAGLIVNFTAAHNFAAGTELQIDMSNGKLLQKNGEVVLDSVPVDSARSVGTAAVIAPKQTNVKDLSNNAAALDGTLVILPQGMFSGGAGKYSGTIQYQDSTGTVNSLVLSSAQFAGKDYPVQTNSLTGIVRRSGTDVRVDIRDTVEVIRKEGFFIVDDFSTAPAGYVDGSSPYYYIKTDVIGTYGFTSGYNVYISTSGRGGFFWIRKASANDPDAGLGLTSGQNYMYSCAVYNTILNSVPNIDYGNTNYGDLLQNIKSITVYTAASKWSLSSDDLNYYYSARSGESIWYKLTDTSLPAFDPTKDGYKIVTHGSSGDVYAQSPVYTNQGVWNKFVINGESLTLNVYDFLIAFQGNPVGSASVQSFYGARWGALTGTTYQPTKTYSWTRPILIGKIVYEYSSKPTWAAGVSSTAAALSTMRRSFVGRTR